jgi:hydrogenase large subunit
MLVAYASGNQQVQEVVQGTLAQLNAPVEALFSTLGRTAARGLETKLVAHWMKEFFQDLITRVKAGRVTTFTRERWDPSTWPDEAEGVGLTEAPRGALAHWIRIRNRKIDNYQLVVPSTWNASPRDAQGQRSSYEASLVGTPVADPEQPLEIIRTVHSFDPCIACAVHLYDPEGKHITDVRVDH